MTTFEDDILVVDKSIQIKDTSGNLLAYIGPDYIGTGPGTAVTGTRIYTSPDGSQNYYQFAQPNGVLNLNCNTIPVGSSLLNVNFKAEEGTVALLSDIPTASTNPFKLFKRRNVSANSLGNTPILTTDSSLGEFIVTKVIVIPTSISMMPTSPAIVTLGTNIPSYDDIVTASVLSNIPYKVNNLNLYTELTAIPPSTEINVNVISTAVGSGRYMFDVYVEGFYTNF